MGRVRDEYFASLSPEQERELYERDRAQPGSDEPDPRLDVEPELPFPEPPASPPEIFPNTGDHIPF
ncbi:hypothetical protein [Methylobacterium gregans]|uniref:Uncharacterized protein n=1 Tax=Methylobacterium gregans TaxID=374424 RepID=A0AA37MBJ6_9HYPH|nr:hypothetical protein [Methylobacterium gregans]MDQ0520064.1 hypothetical protein [Methylobacterium gregans]GJD79173.1 hypothetical protein NBEOAGPD_2394 [Methylobacterium gregans]GLS52465.1 hypothetical protein GCM10007886_06480 [Methylobacterium gregans]